MVCKCVPGSATQLLEHTSPELQRPWKRYLLQQQQQRRSQRHWYGRQYCTNQPLSQTSAQQPPHRPPLPTQHLRPQPVQRQPSHPPALPRIDLQNPSPAARPTFRFPVVVEGHNDRKAVQRALNAKVPGPGCIGLDLPAPSVLWLQVVPGAHPRSCTAHASF